MLLQGALNQKAVYWGNPTKNGFGELSFAVPVELDVRWQDKNEIFIDSEGTKDVSKAVIYLDTDVENDGYLYLGLLADLTAEQKADPTLLDSSYPIRAFHKTTDILGIIYVRKVWL